MGLLKYLGKPEVIKVLGEKAPKKYLDVDGFSTREEHYYPEGTQRIVRKYFLIPKNIGGVRVRGNHLVKQVCYHTKRLPDLNRSAGEYTYEHWRDSEVIPEQEFV